MAAPKEEILSISVDSQNRLVQYVKAAAFIRDEGWQLRQRLEEADRAYMREYDYTEAQQKAKLANRRGDPNKIQNMQTPLVMESAETSVGFLTNVFTTDYPMFKFASGPESEDLALQWNTLVGEDQVEFGWSGEFNQAFRNGEKYNFAPIEVEWEERNKYKSVNGTGGGGSQLRQQIYCGNSITSIDPYNTIYDPRVPIHKCHEEGEFAGYVRMMSRIKLKMFLTNLGDKRLKNDVQAFRAPNWEVEYYIPYINPLVIVRTQNWLLGAENFDWTKWATSEAQKHIEYKNMYTVVTLYARIMPYEFGIRAPKDQTPDVWKLITVNGVLVFAQPMVNAHYLLPLIIAQPLVDNLSHQTKSATENVTDYQFLINSLVNAKLAGARRRVFDRMLYNPLLIDPDHMNSPNPSAKIPIRPTAYGRKLEEAIYKIPFDDANSGEFLQEANGIAEWGMRANGQNRPMLGQFQKGNKLQDEWAQTMTNGSNRERTKALMWQAFCIQPIQVMLKSNYLQFTPAGTRYNRVEEKTVKIDPIALRKSEANFVVGDGLLPVQRLVHTDVMQQAMQTLTGVPGLGAAYDLGPMFSYLMKVQGVDKLSQFEKSKEDQQYEQALSIWSTAAANLAKNTTYGELKPEDMAKILGPMLELLQIK